VRVAFVTTDREGIRDEDVDRPYHERAFAESGVELVHHSWRDGATDWSGYDRVVLRSPWDYCEHREAFLAWLARTDARARLDNPAAVVRWNLDKRYLADLAARGVAVIPTRIASDEEEVQGALAAHGRREVVVKPVVSAGSRNTGRFRADDPAARALARTILGEDLAVMVQPFAASVAERGEVSLVFFAGEPSHAFRKGPLLELGGGLRGGSYREEITPERPTASQRAVAVAAAAAVDAICAERFSVPEPLLYARFDLVRLDDGTEALLEAELFEPAFFLHTDPAAADRFATAVARRPAPRSSPARGESAGIDDAAAASAWGQSRRG